MQDNYSIFQDWKANKGNLKGGLIMVVFRIATLIHRRRITKILFFPILAFHRICIEWILGVEIPFGTLVGKGLCIYHGQSLIINKNSKIGKNCKVRHSTTIGNKGKGEPAPIIGDFVDIGPHVCIIGNITIGDHSIIGAGSVVIHSVPPRSVVVGNPAKVIKVI